MPPFGKLAAVIVSGANRDAAEKVAVWLGQTGAQQRLYIYIGTCSGANLYAAGKIPLPAAAEDGKKH